MSQVSSPAGRAGRRSLSMPRGVSHRNLGVVYVLATVVVIFAIWIPGAFLTYTTLAGILNTSSISCLVALSLVLPLAAGMFDFSVGYALGLTGVLAAYLIGQGDPVGLAIALSIGAGVVIGLANAAVVVVFKVDSFIGTLATGSLLYAAILLITGDQELTNGVTRPAFANVAQAQWHQLTIPVAYALLLAVALWLLLSRLPTGRRIHATGLSREAARLTGVRTSVLCAGALIFSATIAGFAGIVNTAQLGTGSPDIGPSFLIPAYAAVFLGKTQSTKGLFNPWGTVASVLLLGTVTTGLSLAGAPMWAPYVVTGVVLIASIGLANLAGGRLRWRRTNVTNKPTTGHPEEAHASA